MVRLRKIFTRTVILLILVIVIAGAALGGFLFEAAPATVANTHTQSSTFAGTVTGRGGYALADGSHEIFPWPEYISSYLPNNRGEDAAWIVELQLLKDGCKARYSLCENVRVDWVSVDLEIQYPAQVGTTQVQVQYNQLSDKTTWNCGSSVNFPPCAGDWNVAADNIWNVMDPAGKLIIPDGSVVTATATAAVSWQSGFILDKPCDAPNWCSQGSGVVASDQMVVRSTAGKIWFENVKGDAAGGQYASVGDTISLCFQVGYVSVTTGAGSLTGTVYGWHIELYSKAQGKTVLTSDITTATGTRGCAPYTVKAADFIVNGTPSQNGLDLSLWNSFESTKVNGVSVNPIGAEGHIPACYVDKWSPESPKQGDVIYLTYHCVAATSQPQDQIKLIEIRWGFGTYTTDITQPAGSTNYSFTPATSGVINFNLRAETNAGIFSGAQNYDVSVDHQPINTCIGSYAFCHPGPTATGGIPLWIIFVFIGIALLVVALLIPQRFPVPLSVRVILAILGVVMILIAVILYLLVV